MLLSVASLSFIPKAPHNPLKEHTSGGETCKNDEILLFGGTMVVPLLWTGPTSRMSLSKVSAPPRVVAQTGMHYNL